jgi:alpha-glucan phosphorylase-like protein
LITKRTGRRLDPDALTIGFARRFAPYKRGDLLFSDPHRALDLLEQGFQVVYSGKAHPQDQLGREIVQRVLSLASDRRFRDRVVFLEDYDMVLGRALTAGCDLWLNNPRRPREASGTSGQKACLNGGINLSILDGWWPEAYDGTNGFAIGGGHEWPEGDEHAQDAADAEDLYQVLQSSVLPEWSDRTQGTPRRWVQRVRRSIQVGAPLFNSHRMVLDYWHQVYQPLL